MRKQATFVVITIILTLGSLLTSQEPNQLAIPASPGKAIQDAAKAAVQDRTRFGSIDILTNTRGVDFGPYIRDLQSKVRQNWYALIPEDARSKKGNLAIEFTVTKDGQLGAMKLVASSGDRSLDRAAWEGIKAAVPFAEMPEEFKGDYLALRFRFFYNPRGNDLTEARNPVELSNMVEHAELIQGVADLNPPQYPEHSRAAKVDGVVRLEVTVGKDGAVKDVKVLEGESSLAEASVRAVQRWQFRPAKINNGRVEDVVRIKVEFRLEGEQVRAQVVWPEPAK